LTTPDHSLRRLFAGEGAMSLAMRAFDWSATPLGEPHAWPLSLKTLVRVLLSSTQPMFLAWGVERTWLYNDAFTPILGDKHPAALARPSMEVWAEAKEVLEPLFDQVFAGEAVYMEDFGLTLHRRGRSEEAHFGFCYTPAPDDHGHVVGLFGTCIETTAQVVATRTLSAEREQFSQLFEQSPSFITVLRGPEHRFELVNPAYRKLLGHRDLLGMSVREAVPEVDGQGFFELLDGVYSTGQPFRGNGLPITFQLTPDAEPELRYLDFVYQPMRDALGEVSGIFVEGVDVTGSYKAAADLAESEAQFRTLAEAMQNHAWMALPDGNLNWFNSRVYEFSGAVAGELDGEAWARIVHPDDIDEAADRWAAALASGEPYEAEFRLRRADGVYRWHIARAVALRADGLIVSWIGTNTDIEDQKAAAQALADINASLEEQVAARTADLMVAEEALRQSQKMEAVGQLTGGIAHDFNNLLTGIAGSLEMLELRLAEGREDGIQRYLGVAQASTRRAAALTQRLLAFSRRQTLDPKPIDVNRLVAGMDELVRRTVGPTIEVEVVGAGGLWPTRIDPSQLESALLNLAINARDAMPNGGRITIETANKWLDARAAKERDLEAGQYISLCVTDTGAGMTAEVIERAFDPFFTTKPLGGGTGLGLSMVHGFARQSGGQVRIYSEVGVGTTMCLYLPRFAGEIAAAEADEEPSVATAADGETVLVVDDEEPIRMLIAEVLEEAGYRVLAAADGPSGLKVLQSSAHIDLLITDVGLPGGINGRQVADAARTTRPSLKVLFVTGYAENAVIGNGHLEAGMAVITKPFAMASLASRVQEIMERYGS